MFKPELLSPAGTLQNMRYAFAMVDAVYAGQPRYSLRATTNSTTRTCSSASMKPMPWAKILRGGQHRAAQRQAENVHP
jgi:hypothetical protein